MPTTLRIDDEDSVDVVRAVESAFDIVISNAEAAACRTLGDIFVLLTLRFEDSRRNGGSCAYAMAFYRLRRALGGLHPASKLRPSTRLSDISEMSAKRLFRNLERQTGLRLPLKAIGAIGWIGVSVFVAGLLALISACVYYGWLALAFPSAVVIARLILKYDPGNFPRSSETLGGLAKKVAALNFGHLANAGARVDDTELWKALTEVVSDFSLVPTVEMRPNSVLLASLRKAA